MAFEKSISKAQAVCLIYDNLLAPHILFSNFLKLRKILGRCLNLALFVKKECDLVYVLNLSFYFYFLQIHDGYQGSVILHTV